MMRIVAVSVSEGMSGCGLCTEVETFYRGTRTLPAAGSVVSQLELVDP